MTVCVLGCFYILMQYVGTIGFGLDKASLGAWAANPNGMAVLGGRYLGSWNEVWIYLGVLLDILAVASGFTTSMARGLFALGRDRVLPRSLGEVSRTGTPLRANAVILIGAFVMVGAFALAPIQPKIEAFAITAGIGGLLMLLIYLGLGVVLLFRPGNGWPLGILAAAVAIAVSGLGVYGSVWPFPSGTTRWEIWLSLIGIGLAALFAAVTTARASRLAEVPESETVAAPAP